MSYLQRWCLTLIANAVRTPRDSDDWLGDWMLLAYGHDAYPHVSTWQN